MVNLRGVGVALVTPFRADGAVDFDALGRLLDYVKDGGVDYLVVFGTTAETPTLTEQEKREILSYIREWNIDNMPMVLGVGSNNTQSLCDSLKTMDLEGVAAILSVAPYYNKPGQEGIFMHYKMVSEASPVPVIIYNVPSRTGVNITAQTTIRLANECSNIIATKEASGDLSQIAHIIKDAPESFSVISGDDNLTLPIIALGGDGVISVSANAFAKDFCQMVKAAMNEDMVICRSKYYKLLVANDALFAEGNPVGVKCALAIKNIALPYVRLPLVEASENLKTRLNVQIEKYKI